MNWSEDQKQAINASGGTILLSAAAGSGKTAVIIERIINKITDPKSNINIDEILVVTFSNAAATEIRERISKKINELLSTQPHNSHLQKQQILLDTANISTIHSFCQNIIKENFETLNISADFKICNEYQADILKHQAFSEIIDKFYNTNYFNHILKITDTTYDFDKLFKFIKNMFDFLMSLPFPFDWINKNLEVYKRYSSSDTISNCHFFKIIFENSLELLNQAKNILTCCNELVIGLENKAIYEDNFYEKTIFIDKLISHIKNNSWNKTFQLLNSFKITSLPRSKKNIDPELKENIKNLHDQFKEIINDLKSNYFFIDEKDFISDIDYNFEIFCLLSQIISDFSNRYSHLKKSKNFLDFSDLEQLAIKLLLTKNGENISKSEIAKTISSNFKEIFIDEYQDTNLTQEYIFKAISNNNSNLFMVGDAKQSIYRFRQAMPELFTEKYISYHNFDNNHFPAKINLNQNFRSRKSVTSFINFIFNQLMSSDVGEIDYNENQSLIPSLSYPDNKDDITQIHFLKTQFNLSNEEKLYSEAKYIALKIKDMINNKVQVTKNNILTDVSYSDFCVLLRSPNEKLKYFIKAFNDLNIPLAADQPNNLFESTEIISIISFLKIINNPLDDISLMSIMLSEIFQFSSDDILSLRCYNLPSLFQAIREDIKNNNSKFKTIYDQICHFKNLSNFLSLDKLIEIIYAETDFYNIVMINKNGPKRQLNLDLFKNLAKEFSESNNNNLIEFIYYINNLIDQKSSLQINSSDIVNENNCVKIMSIHRSKGLEFPICILADTSRQINKIDIRSPILYHSTTGIGINRFDLQKNIKFSTLPKNAVKIKIENNMLSEELRILYVALTRAREKLIIIISDNNYENKFHYWNNLLLTSLNNNFKTKISPYIIKQAKNYEDFFIISLLRHPQIKNLNFNITNNSLTNDIPEVKIIFESIDNKNKTNIVSDPLINNNHSIKKKNSLFLPF